MATAEILSLPPCSLLAGLPHLPRPPTPPCLRPLPCSTTEYPRPAPLPPRPRTPTSTRPSYCSSNISIMSSRQIRLQSRALSVPAPRSAPSPLSALLGREGLSTAPRPTATAGPSTATGRQGRHTGLCLRPGTSSRSWKTKCLDARTTITCDRLIDGLLLRLQGASSEERFRRRREKRRINSRDYLLPFTKPIPPLHCCDVRYEAKSAITTC
jgi:hypothetical protein